MSSLLAPAHGGTTRVNCFPSPLTCKYIQLRASAFHGAPVVAFLRVTPQLSLVSKLPPHGRLVACLFSGKREPIEDEERDTSLWKSLKNSMGIFKKRSIDDVLREQIREQELTGGGGSGGPPRGGGGGDGSGGTEDEGPYEFLQVVFAALGFFFLYIYLIYGEDMYRLAKDYIIYLFTARTSVRLKRAMRKWVYPWRRIIRSTGKDYYKEEGGKVDWLERAILATRAKWKRLGLQRPRMMPDDD